MIGVVVGEISASFYLPRLTRPFCSSFRFYGDPLLCGLFEVQEASSESSLLSRSVLSAFYGWRSGVVSTSFLKKLLFLVFYIRWTSKN